MPYMPPEMFKVPAFNGLDTPDYVCTVDTPGSTVDIEHLGSQPEDGLILTDSGNVYLKTNTALGRALIDLRTLSKAFDPESAAITITRDNPLPSVTIGERWNIPRFRITSAISKVMVHQSFTVPFGQSRIDAPLSPFEAVRHKFGGVYDPDADSLQLRQAAHTALRSLSQYR